MRLAALLVVAAVLGCDPVVRYRVLSFFLDGVPPPVGAATRPRQVIGRWGVPLDPDDPRAKAFLARAASRAARVAQREEPTYLHAPFQKRLCPECHDSRKSFQAPTNDVACQKCHALHYTQKWDDWVHGPVALGKCSMCHLPHLARYPGLLTTDVQSLCFSCHDASRLLPRPHHAAAKDKPCTTCHDPHLAGNRLLLVDSGSAVRRKRRLKLLPSKHNDWDKKTCTKCHDVTRSKQVVGDVDKVCLSCHTKQQQPPPGRKLHEPVVKGQCVSCHTAHKSSVPYLIKPEAEKNCLGSCHKLDKVLTDAHPPIRRGECLLCHTGHSSPRKHLLRPVGTSLWQDRPDAKKTAASKPAREAKP